MARRPEHKAPPEIFYGLDEAKKYTQNSRIIEVQRTISERAIELLALPEDVPCFLLDLGCGSGLSGECLDDYGHTWVGMDIAPAMLGAATERGVEGDLLLADLGHGVGFRAGSFDGAISISTLQWLCNADKRCHHPQKRLLKLFSSLYACLSRGSRAVFQFYPENSAQVELMTSQAMRAGFSGGLVVDYPNSTKAKKMYLVLMTGGTSALPQAITEEDEQHMDIGVKYEKKREQAAHRRERRGKPVKKSRQWIREKKERRRRQGLDSRHESKYTGRRRTKNI